MHGLVTGQDPRQRRGDLELSWRILDSLKASIWLRLMMVFFKLWVPDVLRSFR